MSDSVPLAAEGIPDTTVLDLSDDELVENTRSGSVAAMEELWARHSVFGLIAANSVAPDRAQDVNTAAWKQILSQIQQGHAPRAGFRPHLYSTIHQIAQADAPSVPSARMTQALTTLPPRWQEVLWYLDVEQMSGEDVALLTDITPEAVPEIQSRARRGLKDAWLRVNAEAASDECAWVRHHSRAYLRKTLPQPDLTRVNKHLASCSDCQEVIATARQMGSRVPGMLLAGVAGTTAGGALATYLKASGPIVINEDPLPQAVADAFTPEPIVAPPASVPPEQQPQTYVEQEHKRRRRGALWIALLILLALIGLIAAVAWLASWGNDPATDPSQTATVSSTPSVSPTPTPTPSRTPTRTPTPTPTPTPTVPPPAPTTNAPPAPEPPPPPPSPASIDSVDSHGGLYPVIAGWANPWDTVYVSFAGETGTAAADGNGYWAYAGPYPGIAPGLYSVTVSGTSNTAPSSSQFEVAGPPGMSSNTIPGGASVNLVGIPGATVQVVADQSSSSLVTLDGSGYGSVDLTMGTGQHAVSVRYYEGGRFGPTSGTMLVNA